MKTATLVGKTMQSKAMTTRSSVISATMLLFVLLTLATRSQSQDFVTSPNTANNSMAITGYAGPGGDVVIPSDIDGLPVTLIGGSAFYSCTNLTGITIPNTVTAIEAYAFAACTRLTRVAIPGSVRSIGNAAFRGCLSLANVTIAEGVTALPSNIFNDCTNLTRISLPASLLNIDPGLTPFSMTVIPDYTMFHGCTSLTNITVDPLNLSFISVDGVLLDKNQTTLIRCPEGKIGSIAMPDSVTKIADWAFYFCESLTHITIPDRVVSLGDGAFERCKNLGSLMIPDSVVSLGNRVFIDCERLGDIAVPGRVTKIGDWAFNGCKSLGRIVIPDSVTNNVASVGYGWFCGCSSLTNATLSTNMSRIPYYTFQDCTNLIRITIPVSVTSIDEWAFDGCSHLTEVFVLGDAPRVFSMTAFWNTKATLYHLARTKGWSQTVGGRPTALWLPKVQPDSIGMRTNQFGFNIFWARKEVVVVEACANISAPIWAPLQTNTLTCDTLLCIDPQWTNGSTRFYRLRSQ